METGDARAISTIFQMRDWRTYIPREELPRLEKEFRAWKKAQKKEAK